MLNSTNILVRIAIVGAGALGQQIAQHLLQDGRQVVAGFFDDVLPLNHLTANGSILGRTNEVLEAFTAGQFDQLLLGIGYNHLAVRQQLFEQWVPHIPFATFVHPSVSLDSSVDIEPGCFLSPGCIIDLNVRLGPNTFLYPGCIIAHDTRLLGHIFLAPGVRLAGHITVAERCFLGIGTTVSDNLSIGPDIRTGAGTVVVTNLDAPGTYVGVPSRMLSPVPTGS